MFQFYTSLAVFLHKEINIKITSISNEWGFNYQFVECRALKRIPNEDDLAYMYDELAKLGRYTGYYKTVTVHVCTTLFFQLDF